ncbi:MAG: hypothetical protein WAN34_00585, partial [Acidimicrobiia bacterium]
CLDEAGDFDDGHRAMLGDPEEGVGCRSLDVPRGKRGAHLQPTGNMATGLGSDGPIRHVS